MMLRTLIAALAPLASLVPAAVAATTCEVPAPPYPTVQAAADDPTCETIALAAGTYVENVRVMPSTRQTLRIVGEGMDVTTIDGANTGTTLDIALGDAGVAVELVDLTISGGDLQQRFVGAGVNVVGSESTLQTVSVQRVRITDNVARGSDSVVFYVDQVETLTVDDSLIDDNLVERRSILVNFQEMTVRNTVLSGNTGGRAIEAGDLTILDTQCFDNASTCVRASKLFMDRTSIHSNPGLNVPDYAVSVDGGIVRNSVVYDNRGGGINFLGVGANPVLLVENVTISGQRSMGALSAFRQEGRPGDPSVALLRNATIVNNAGQSQATGLTTFVGVTLLQGTIVANNGNAQCIALGDSQHISLGHNLSSDSSCSLTESSDLQNVLDARLGPLRDNGGPTKTHALASDSPAVDAGVPPSQSGCPATDQRGAPRPQGAACDIGAFERQP